MRAADGLFLIGSSIVCEVDREDEARALQGCGEFFRGLSDQWQPMDLQEMERLPSALLMLATATGLAECRFKCKAWTDAAAMEAQVTVMGLWLDVEGKSVLPAEFRKAIPAWEAKRVSVQPDPQFQVRLTNSGIEAQADIRDKWTNAWMVLMYMTKQPRPAIVKMRLLGETHVPGQSQASIESSPSEDQIHLAGVLAKMQENQKTMLSLISANSDELQKVATRLDAMGDREASDHDANTALHDEYLMRLDRVTQSFEKLLSGKVEALLEGSKSSMSVSKLAELFDKQSISRRRAWMQWFSAQEAIPQCTDREAYDWIKSHMEPGDTLASFLTWTRYLRAVRKALGLQKYGGGKPLATGKSVVNAKDVEPNFYAR